MLVRDVGPINEVQPAKDGRHARTLMQPRLLLNATVCFPSINVESIRIYLPGAPQHYNHRVVKPAMQ